MRQSPFIGRFRKPEPTEMTAHEIRCFAVEQAVKWRSATAYQGASTQDMVREFERYILTGVI